MPDSRPKPRVIRLVPRPDDPAASRLKSDPINAKRRRDYARSRFVERCETQLAVDPTGLLRWLEEHAPEWRADPVGIDEGLAQEHVRIHRCAEGAPKTRVCAAVRAVMWLGAALAASRRRPHFADLIDSTRRYVRTLSTANAALQRDAKKVRSKVPQRLLAVPSVQGDLRRLAALEKRGAGLLQSARAELERLTQASTSQEAIRHRPNHRPTLASAEAVLLDRGFFSQEQVVKMLKDTRNTKSSPLTKLRARRRKGRESLKILT